MDKITIDLNKEDGSSITFSVNKSHDILISDILGSLPMERHEYILHWLHEKTTSVSKQGCEWRLWIPSR